MNHLLNLRKNASLASIAAATRKQADHYWSENVKWREAWKNGSPADWSHCISKMEEASTHASELDAIAKHLERIIESK